MSKIKVFVYNQTGEKIDMLSLDVADTKELRHQLKNKAKTYKINVFMIYFDEMNTKNTMYFNNQKSDEKEFKMICREFVLNKAKATIEDLENEQII